MKNIVLAITILLFTGAAYAESSAPSQSFTPIPAESMVAGKPSGVKQVEAPYVCMVTNKAFDKPQIPVKVGEKTYYGCCETCKARLEKDAQARQAIDPVTGKTVDKALAVIGAAKDRSVYYFETKDNLEKFNKGEQSTSRALGKEHIVKEISDPAGNKPYYFEPSELTIQPGDTVTFVNAQDDMHDVMFVEMPKGVDEMIMSPMHEKEGDKFSYAFTVPGTYQYHCHPHEALGMKGTLIVGAPSKPGETVAMDHHKMGKKAEGGTDEHGHAAASNLIDAVGKVNSTDAAGHTVNITHDPIKALNWPKMKMEFSVDKGIDLSGFKAGDAILFKLKSVGEDDFLIVEIKKGQ